jgi:hypothetical protein
MALAEKRAQTLIEFTGMQAVPRPRSTQSADRQKSGESQVDEDHNISVSITKHYDIVYNDVDNDSQMRESLHAAASITQERHSLDCDLDSLDNSTIDSDELTANRISIASLLNPEGELVSCDL